LMDRQLLHQQSLKKKKINGVHTKSGDESDR
jgi:hypothetical protein